MPSIAAKEQRSITSNRQPCDDRSQGHDGDSLRSGNAVGPIDIQPVDPD